MSAVAPDQTDLWLANKLANEWSSHNLTSSLTRETMTIIRDTAWKSLEPVVKIKFLFALTTLRRKQEDEFGHIAKALFQMAADDVDDWVRVTANMLISLSPDAVEPGDPLATFQERCEPFREIVEAVRTSWEAGEPRFVPLEFGLLDVSQLDAAAPALTERAIGERHFALNESIDTSIAAIFSNSATSGVGAASQAGGGSTAAGTGTGAISAARAALKFSRADQQPVSASHSIASLRQKFSTEQGTAAQARGALSVLPSSSSLAALTPTAAHPTHSIFAPRRSNSASGAARLAAGGTLRHKVNVLSIDEIAHLPSRNADAAGGIGGLAEAERKLKEDEKQATKDKKKQELLSKKLDKTQKQPGNE